MDSVGESIKKESGHADWLLIADHITLLFSTPSPRNLGLNASSARPVLGYCCLKK